MLVEIQYFNERNQPREVRMIWPGIESYWECDREKLEEPYYVRRNAASDHYKKTSQLDINRIDPWERTMLFAAAHLYSVRVTLFDVDRRGMWEKVSGTLTSILENLSGPVSSLLAAPLSIPAAVEATLIEKLAAGEDSTDKILFRHSHLCPPVDLEADQVIIRLDGQGRPGSCGCKSYHVDLALRVL